MLMKTDQRSLIGLKTWTIKDMDWNSVVTRAFAKIAPGNEVGTGNAS